MPSALSEIAYQAKAYWNYPQEWLDSWIPELTVTKADILFNKTFVLKIDNQLSGFTMVSDKKDFLEIEHFWILPRFIGQGWGSRLMQHTITEIAPLSQPICALADPHAEPFYAKHGFIVKEYKPSSIPGRTLPWMERKND